MVSTLRCFIVLTMVQSHLPDVSAVTEALYEQYCKSMLPVVTKLCLKYPVPEYSPEGVTFCIVESREDPLLIFVICNAVLMGQSRFRVEVVCCPSNVQFVRNILLTAGVTGVHVRLVEQFSSAQEYNALCLSPSFWEGFRTRYVWLMQMDSMLTRAPTKAEVQEFQRFAYIGAPWTLEAQRELAPHQVCAFNHIVHKITNGVGNGGFSWRSASAMRSCLLSFPPDRTPVGGLGIERASLPEDVYFSLFLSQIEESVAPVKVAEKFSCETTFHPDALGWHAIFKYHTTQVLVHYLMRHYSYISLQSV